MKLNKRTAVAALGLIALAVCLIVIISQTTGKAGTKETQKEVVPVEEQNAQHEASPEPTTPQPAGVTIRLEAEDAELTGLTIGEDSAVSGQKFVEGFDAAGDRLRFQIKLDEPGAYMLTIRYKTFGGDKPNVLTLNGTKLAEYTFPASASWTDALIGQFHLNKGTNTFDIDNSWGWIAVDYIELTGGSGGPVTNVTLAVSGDGSGPSDEAIIMTAKADNASRYRFFAKKDAGEWIELNTYSTQHQLTWLPPAPGQYELKVYARGLDSRDEYEAESIASYTVLLEYEGKPLVHPLFGNDMVLQRESEATAVWGWAQPGQAVDLSIDGLSVGAAVADVNGRWSIPTGAFAPGGPHELVVGSGSEQVVFGNVLFGDVWLASGQSNMEFKMSDTLNAQEEIDKADQSNIRFMTVPTLASRTPLSTFKQGVSWQPISPSTASQVTAVGYFFARDIHEATGVPIGLLFSSLGGTKAETWTSYETMQTLPDYAAAAEKIKSGAAVIETMASPAVLYNGMIAPLTPYALKGVIWYQGEANWGEQQYNRLLPAFMQDWRSSFRNDELPFVIIQISAFGTLQTDGNPAQTYAGLPEVREAQWLTVKQDSNACLVVTTDLGDPLDIHPRNKQDVGARSALCALSNWYGHNSEFSGPMYEAMEPKDNTVVLSFSHTGKGLMAGFKDGLNAVTAAPDGKLVGFAVAGDNNRFFPADAVIKGDQIVVSSPNVEKPTHVRYGWFDAPVANLYNKNGLPATPFRTDVPE